MARRVVTIARSCFLVVLSLAASRVATAQWNHDGKLLCNLGNGSTHQPVVVQDGSGGAIHVWVDARFGRSIIVAQRTNASGYTLWTLNGVMLSNLPTFNQFNPRAIPDGSGGAFVSYEYFEASGGDIYVQRVNSAGVRQWGTNGTLVCNAANTQTGARIVSDGAGGVIVAWLDSRAGTDNYDIYAQRLNGAGVVQWTANGLPVCTATANQTFAEMASDGANGSILAWMDARGADPDIYAQRIDGSGARLWLPADGVLLSTASGTQRDVAIAADGASGGIVAWDEFTNNEVRVQRLDASGSALWTSGGVDPVGGTSYQSDPVVLSGPSGGAILAWTDRRSGTADVYAQRFDGTGAPQWMTDGVPLTTAANQQLGQAIVSDGASGAIAMWLDDRSGPSNTYDLYAQRVSASGEIAWWHANGVAACNAAGTQQPFALVADGTGGAFALWSDERAANSDMYATRLMANGNLAALAADITAVTDEPQDEGGAVRIALTGAPADSGVGLPEVTGYNLWRRVSPAGSIVSSRGAEGGSGDPSHALERGSLEALMARSTRGPVLLGAEQALAAGLPPGTWTSLGFTAALQATTYMISGATRADSTAGGSAAEVYAIAVHTTMPSVWVVGSPDSGHSVDNLAPAPPQNLGAERTGPGSAFLHWDANSENDLQGYVVYRGASAEFVPGPGNRIGTPSSPSFTDGGFTTASYYKVSALDRHGNESPFALLEPADVVGAPSPDLPRTSYLGNPAPNPLGSRTEIVFGLHAPARVSLRIYDVGGRLVRVLVDGWRPPGVHLVPWDARDAAGHAVPVGLYVARLIAPGIDRTRKLVVAG